MSLAEKTNVTAHYINVAAVGAEDFGDLSGRPLPVDKLIAASAFASEEVTALVEHLEKARQARRYDYDIQIADDGVTARAGLIVLTSRNFGYDFALVMEGGTKGFLGRRRTEVRILRSHCGRDSFTAAGAAPSLAKAMRVIDQMYYDAAAAHLA